MRGAKKIRGLPVGGPFTPIRCDLHDSRSYHELTGNAAKLYGYLVRTARSVAYKLGVASEDLVDFDYTYSEAKKRGFSESTFKRAIQELWSAGMISVVAIGGRTASDARGRMSSKYKLSAFWKSYGVEWKDRTVLEASPWMNPSEPKAGDRGRW